MLATYGAAVVAAFVFFDPVVTAMPLSWDAWHARMIPDVLGIPYTSRIMPHPDRP